VDDAMRKLAQFWRTQNDPDIHIEKCDKDIRVAVAFIAKEIDFNGSAIISYKIHNYR
jgi:hypothetical protein